METSLRHRGDLHIPLSRPLAILPRPADPPEATDEGEQQAELTLLQPDFATRPNHTQLRPDLARAQGLMLGLRAGEIIGLDGRGGDTTGPSSPGPAGREAAVLGELAIRGPISPRRLAQAMTVAFNDPASHAHAWLQPFRETGDWRRGGTASAGCEAMLRALPLAVVLAGEPASVVSESISTALVTHRDVRAIAATVTGVWAAREALTLAPGPVNTAAILETLAARCRSAERILVRRSIDLLAPAWRNTQHAVSNAIYRCSAAGSEGIGPVLDILMEHLNVRDEDEEVGITPDRHVGLILPLGLLIAFQPEPAFASSMLQAAELPVAGPALSALVGALVGARLGSSQIPRQMLNRVSGNERAIILARALARDPTAIRENRV